MKKKFAMNGKVWLFLTALLTLAVYFLGMRQWLGLAIVAQIELIVLSGLPLVLLGVILFLLVTLLALIFSRNRAPRLTRLRGQMIWV